MFVNIRYLVITLISVFIALGIGILIGFQLDSNDIILQQQQELITSLEATFDDLTQTNQALEAEVKSLQQSMEQDRVFMETIATDYLEHQLLGQNIVIIETSASSSSTQLKRTLQAAGANVNASIVITDKVLLGNQDQGGSNPELPLAPLVANAVAYGETDGLSYLRQQGLVEISGIFDTPPDFVIIAGGNNTATDKPELVDVPLIRELKKRALPIVGVESSQVEYSYMDHYKKERISTVDNVDTIIGRTSLVLVMTGKEGNYGVKASANTLLPLK